MGRELSSTDRRLMPENKVRSALEKFLTPSTWPEWNSNADSMLATKAEVLEVSDHVAIHQMIKGGLIEMRWVVSEIRRSEDFCEVVLDCEGMSRNERPIGKGLKDLKTCVTFLFNDGGIEIHHSCTISKLMIVFSKKIKQFMKNQSAQLLNDLDSIE